MTETGFEQHEPQIGSLHVEKVSDENSAFTSYWDVYEYQGEREVLYYHRESQDPFYIYKWKRVFSTSSKSTLDRWLNNRRG